MKKIFSILILAVAGILAAHAATITIGTNANNTTVGIKTNIVSGTYRYNYGFTNQSISPTTSGNYYTFNVKSGTGTNYRTITVTIPDGVTYFEITSGFDNVTSVSLSSATNLASICLKGCTNISSVTLGTMNALTDVDVSNTNADVVGAITKTNCPNVENLNVANCGLTDYGYIGTNLYSLDVSDNNISTLNVSWASKLDILRCEGNHMTSLTLPAGITTLSAQNNNLTGVSGYGEPMQILDVASNNLSTLEMSAIVNLTDLDISSNHLTFRSFPSATYKPARMLYEGNDGTYDLSDQMRAAFGSYSYPLMSMLPNYAGRTDASYTLHLADALLDGHNEKNVTAVPNSYDGTTYTPLAQATSDVDGNDYTIDATNDYYGFMKPQSRVRIAFTDATYPGLTLYSNDFTVPTSVTGTLKIVDIDGETLYTKTNAVFSDAVEDLPDDVKRDYTKYTYPAVPTTNGQTWTVTAEPSDDAPFAWAKTYETANWYYMSVGTSTKKWVTADEKNGVDGTPNGGHALKASYDTNNQYYQWAFVGNQYSGFKIYNKGCGSSKTLQDYSGYYTPTSGGMYPIMRDGTSLTWIVRTNSAGDGFSLANKNGGTDGGVNAPCFLNNFQDLGYMNYWITSTKDAQNDAGSLINVLEASGALSATVKWVLMDGSNPVYTITEDVTAGQSITAYPSELTTMASQRFVTLPTLTAFTATSGENRKEIAYTWTGPFTISTTGNEHHYKLKIRNALYITSDLMSGGQLDCTTTDGSENKYRWMFFGDPFNGFIIRNYAKSGKALAAANGSNTNGESFPTFEDEGTRWIITTCTQAGYTNPFSIAPAGISGVYWNQFGGTANNQGVKYYSKNGTEDAGAAIQAIELAAAESVYITWNVLDANGNTVFTTESEHALNSAVTTYPTEMTNYENRYVSYPAISNLVADQNKTINVTYGWTGPFTPSTEETKHWYYVKIHNKYLYADGTASRNCPLYSSLIAARNVAWAFVGDPFHGFKIVPFGNQDMNLKSNGVNFNGAASRLGNNNTVWHVIKSTDTQFSVKHPDANSYWNDYSGGSQLANWQNDASSSEGSVVTVEDADLSILLAPGYYRIRCAAEGYTDVYMSVDETDSKMCNNRKYDKSTDLQLTAFRLEEQNDGTFVISKNGYYLVGANNATKISSDATKCKVGYNNSYSAYTIYMQSNYANIDTWSNDLSSWSLEDRSTWLIEPVVLTGNTLDNTNYFSTAYLPFDYTLPEGVKAYTITIDDKEAMAHELEGGVPTGTGVLVVGKGVQQIPLLYEGYAPTSDDETNLNDNLLTGTYTNIPAPTGIYIFSAVNNIPGFYHYSGTTLNAYKAYIPADGLSEARGFVLHFDNDGNVTGIIPIIDSQLTIDNEGGDIYDLSGRKMKLRTDTDRLESLPRGIYIQNGKKVVVK